MITDHDPYYVQLCWTLAQEEARAGAEWFWPELQVWGTRDAGDSSERTAGESPGAWRKP